MSNEYDEEDEDDWEGDNDWNNEESEAQDVKDEGAAYLEFLNEEVWCLALTALFLLTLVGEEIPIACGRRGR